LQSIFLFIDLKIDEILSLINDLKI